MLDFEVGVQDSQVAITHLQTKVHRLEDCIKDMQLDMNIHDPRLMENEIDDTRKNLNAVGSKLQTEDRLTKAEETIEVLNLRLLTLEARASKPKVSASKPTPTIKGNTH